MPAFLVQVPSFSSTQRPRAPLPGVLLGDASDLRPSRARISAGSADRRVNLGAGFVRCSGLITSAAPMTRIVTYAHLDRVAHGPDLSVKRSGV